MRLAMRLPSISEMEISVAATFTGVVSFDFVIVGSGAASVPAALVAQSVGKTAVILEKQDKFGGSTAYSGGVLWIPNSPLHGSDDSEEAGRTYLNAVIAATGDPGKASPPAKACSKSWITRPKTAAAHGR